jgi:elongator complex protein 3
MDETLSDMSFYQEICSFILSNENITKGQIQRLKIKLCKAYQLKDIPSNSDIITHIPTSYSDDERNQLINMLQRKPMRTISGVAIIAIMTSPEICPHGTCLPCPGGPDYNSPQSYTGFEPAAMRARTHHFDPFQQVKARLAQLSCIGHPTDKIDLIIMGGTFTSRDPWYQNWYIKRCYDALNDVESNSLLDAMIANETATHRCIGLTIETRPDWFRLQHADQLLEYGATRIELGVQHVFDIVLNKMRRGHTVLDTIDATRIAKDAGFKVCYHLMPGLPGSSNNLDRMLFESVFQDERFKPDMIKIYPCLVIKGTQLYNLWENNEYKPLTSSEATRLLSKVLSKIPEWIRIQRIQRDVPAQFIDGGVRKSNLRQLVDDDFQKKHIVLNDLRNREIGHLSLRLGLDIDISSPILKKTIYQASGSTEIFLSLVEPIYNAVIGYLRLRLINSSHRPELIHTPLMMIRELKVLGKEVEIGMQLRNGIQHKGFGSMLLAEAKRISIEEYDCNQLFVLSGVGVKQYYRKYHRFVDHGVYLSKKIIG